MVITPHKNPNHMLSVSGGNAYRSPCLGLSLTSCQVHHVQFAYTNMTLAIRTRLKRKLKIKITATNQPKYWNDDWTSN